MSRSRGREILRRTRQCLPRIREVWARSGVDFDLHFDSDRDPTLSDPDHEVHVFDASQRGDDEHFYYRNQFDHWVGVGVPIERAEVWRQEQYCRMILHETAHKLGLADEYYESRCDAREYISPYQRPYSVMGEVFNPEGIAPASWGEWVDIDFFPHHFRQILSPVCGG